MSDQSTVLVVDDELGFRELMSLELGSRGFRVLTAASGDEAIRIVRTEKIDVVISDITMPKRDGFAALEELKAIDSSLPVILATGYATIETAVDSIKRGASDFIAKPFQIDDLEKMIQTVLAARVDGRRPLAPSVLVVDDDESVVDYLAAALSGDGFRVEALGSGKAALKRLADSAPPNVLFLDLMMPGISGFEILDFIGRQPELARLVVIVLTAKHLTNREREYLDARADAVIEKGTTTLRDMLQIARQGLASRGCRGTTGILDTREVIL